MIKAALVIIIGYFLVLYLVAYFANRDYREEDDILFVSRSQWRAILIMWLPAILAMLLKE